MKTIRAWSFSALSTFEECPYRMKLARLDKIPEPQRPPPPNGKEHGNERGIRLHDNAEQYIRGLEMLDPELKEFKPELTEAARLFRANQATVEDMWCFDDAWRPVGCRDWHNIWLRVKIDLLTFLSPEEALVVDLKTGKRFGNEVKHAQQCQLYQLVTFHRYPKLQRVHTELWYPDTKELSHLKFERHQGERFFRGFNERGLRMTSATEFPAKPNRKTCMFCPYGPKDTSNKWVNKSGDCPHGV